jgi:hypothetical protein
MDTIQVEPLRIYPAELRGGHGFFLGCISVDGGGSFQED